MPEARSDSFHERNPICFEVRWQSEAAIVLFGSKWES
jgi:hypothetical protein